MASMRTHGAPVRAPLPRDGAIRAVIPMKPLALAKQRLAGVLSPEKKDALVLWMMGRVIEAGITCPGLGEIAVIGGDEAVATYCARVGAQWEPDPALELNATLEMARRSSFQAGWLAMLYLPTDVPLVTAADLGALIRAPRSPQLVLVPGRRLGTNAILVPKGAEFGFQLGGESFRRHLEDTVRRGTPCQVFHNAHLEADIDLPEDLRELEEARPDLRDRLASRPSAVRK